MFYQGTAQALADKFIVFRDDYGAVSRLLLELIRAEALTRGYHIITCPCAMHPEDKIDHILIPELKLAFLTDNRWHPVHLPSVQAVRCTRFLDRKIWQRTGHGCALTSVLPPNCWNRPVP